MGSTSGRNPESRGSWPCRSTKVNKMRILFIDDEPERARPFLDAGYDVFITDNVEVIELYLSTLKFDLICLDHDLGKRRYTGADIAKNQLAEHNVPVVIHSCNPSGVETIRRILEEYNVPNITIPCYDGWFDEVLNWKGRFWDIDKTF